MNTLPKSDDAIKREFAILNHHFHELFALTSELRERKIPWNDHFDLMVLCFLGKQIEHTQAILGLVDLELYRDAGLIARSMLEGLIQLLWAGQDESTRPIRWREFSAVSSWRKLKKWEMSGGSVDPQLRKEIEDRLRQTREKFYSHEAKQRCKNGKPLPPDPYVSNWTGQSYSRCFLDVNAKDLFNSPYASFSEWHHWDPEGFEEALYVYPDSAGYSLRSPSLRSGASALANGFQCLFETLRIADNRFTLGLKGRLETLRQNYLELANR